MEKIEINGPLKSSHLAKIVSLENGIPLDLSKGVVSSVFTAIARTLQAGHRVTVRHFGSFYQPNPHGGTTGQVAFDTARNLRESLREGTGEAAQPPHKN